MLIATAFVCRPQVKVWGKKIGIPASLPVTYASEIKDIKKKTNKQRYSILSQYVLTQTSSEEDSLTSGFCSDRPEKLSRSASITRWFKRKVTH